MKQPKATMRAWPYRATMPQRYAIPVETYHRVGGAIDLDELVRGFVPDGMPQADMTRFYGFALVYEQLLKENIPGDLVELGTYQGRTATLLARMARRMGRTLHVLDTFEGFDPRDITGHDATVQAASFADTSLDAVRARVGEEAVRFVKGYFPETAAELPADGRYCLAHIDCDLYAPIMAALEYFYPRMSPGGFIIVHDYTSPSWAGAERAVDEFFATKPESVIPLPDGAGSAIIRRMRAPSAANNWLLRKRAALLTQGWALAGNAGLREILGEGWRPTEAWGGWGLAPRHDLHLAFPGALGTAVTLEADVQAFLAGEQTEQRVTLRLDGAEIDEWRFTKEANRAVRSVRLPLAERGRNELASVTLSLHPERLGVPAELDPALAEKRPLGVGLFRLRLRRG
jgi:predicted O-methyltransferase YrrM